LVMRNAELEIHWPSDSYVKCPLSDRVMINIEAIPEDVKITL
jgi:hypothetical protein